MHCAPTGTGRSLELQHNKLTGRLPAKLSAMTSLKFLDVSHNKLKGPAHAAALSDWGSNLEYVTGSHWQRTWLAAGSLQLVTSSLVVPPSPWL